MSKEQKCPKSFSAQRRLTRVEEYHRKLQIERTEYEQYWDDHTRRTLDGGRIIRKQLTD